MRVAYPLLPLVAAVVAAASNVFWTGEVGGRPASWTPSDITVGSFSLANFVHPLMDRAHEFDPGTQVEYDAWLASAVGPYMSVSWQDYWNAPVAAHPGGEGNILAIDVARPKHPVRLDELFPPAAIHDALLKEPLIAAAFPRLGEKAAKDLPALLVQLQSLGLDVNMNSQTDGHMCGTGEDLMRHFAFHHVEGRRVAVRLGIASITGADRYYWTQLGIWLPVPPALAAALSRATRAHTLLADFERFPASHKMHLAYTTPLGKPR